MAVSISRQASASAAGCIVCPSSQATGAVQHPSQQRAAHDAGRHDAADGPARAGAMKRIRWSDV